MNKHTAVNFWAFIALGDEKIFLGLKLFVFVKNFWLCLFPTKINHSDLKIVKNCYFLAKIVGNTKSKKFLETRETWCWFRSITYFSNPDIRPIGKKLDHFKVTSQRGGGTARNSESLKTPHLSVWNHIRRMFMGGWSIEVNLFTQKYEISTKEIEKSSPYQYLKKTDVNKLRKFFKKKEQDSRNFLLKAYFLDLALRFHLSCRLGS